MDLDNAMYIHHKIANDLDPGSSVEKTGKFLASSECLGFCNFYLEVGLESANLSVDIPTSL